MTEQKYHSCTQCKNFDYCCDDGSIYTNTLDTPCASFDSVNSSEMDGCSEAYTFGND